MGDSKVYVVQDQQRFDKVKRMYVPKFNLEPARDFGELVFVLGPQQTPFEDSDLILDMKSILAHYSDHDYLLLIGNPALIGITVALAAAANEGRLKMLQWSGRDQCYLPISADI